MSVDSAEKAREALKVKRESGWKPTRLSPVEKSDKNPKSLRYAINAKCWDCSCGQTVEIKECGAVGCPLWKVSPYK